jgi:hypothetical protein
MATFFGGPSLSFGRRWSNALTCGSKHCANEQGEEVDLDLFKSLEESRLSRDRRRIDSAIRSLKFIEMDTAAYPL